MKDKKRIGNRLKSLLYKYGQILPEEKGKITQKWIKEIMAYKIHPEIDYTIQVLGKRAP